MRVVVALGGNALLRRGEPLDVETQRANVKVAASAIADLVPDHQLVVTHGNGPQVGLLALQAAAYRDVPPYPLDVLGAESEGMVGYLLEQAVTTELPHQPIATLLTQVEVSAGDPAFRLPSKPVGPLFDDAAARTIAAARGWVFRREAGNVSSYRRVVPSPEPKSILELSTIRLLVDAGVLVICAGGGGIPVVVDEAGAVRGVEAVIDKDLSAAMLAERLDADVLLMLTDVDAVYTGWATPEAQAIARGAPAQLRSLDLAAGSMAPKVEAACRFVEGTGGRAAIGSLHDALAVIEGRAGTTVTATAGDLRRRHGKEPR